ncbi:MAG: peptidoglycan-binding protein [Cognatishimia sp.]|uniref:peptidoglycan-binding domain-containing protein n=1 Tax=Cognatishimia sp. TaxID=2211648 RepID=UPI003B8B34AC
MRFFCMALAIVLTWLSAPAQAKDLALVIDQQDHRRLPDLRQDSRMRTMLVALEEAGFDVTLAEDATVGELRAAAFALDAEAHADVDRIIVLVRGHLVTNGLQTWVLGQGSATPDRFDIGSKGLDLGLFDQSLQQAAGRAIIAIVDDPRPLSNLSDLTAGSANTPLGQGITGLTGDSAEVARSLDALLKDGTSTQQVSELEGGARLSGFISRTVTFTQPSTATEPSSDFGEIAYWSAVRDIGTPEALNAYLGRYPNGAFARDARRQLEARVQDREARVKAAETAMGLNRDRRRSIQRDLALIGYDPRGVDGVFGPATRRAIAAWQSDQGLETHGYLDRDQLGLLQDTALRRAAELEEEARRRREIEDARDRAFWQETGSRRTENGYRRYLRSFPDGIYADIAREEIAAIEEERRAELNAQEREAWEIAQNANDIEGYRQFLSAFPNGEFADVAKARIEELDRDSENQEAARRFTAIEQAVAGNTAARLLIERRLSDLGLKPGSIDGRFTKETRRALRRFQKARRLEVTGYVNQPTMVQLLLGR